MYMSPIDRNSMQARNGSGSTPNFTGSVDGFSASGSGAAPGSAGPGDSAAPSMMMYSTTPHRDAFSNDYSASLGMGSSGATYFGSGGYGSDFVDIVIADPLHFDPLIFDCWLEGRTPEFAVNAKLSRQKQSRAGSVNHMEQGPSLLSPSPGSAGLPSQQLSRQPAPTPTPPVPSSANSLATPPQHGSLSSAVHRQQTYPDDDVDSTWGSDPLLLELLRHDALDQYHTYEILEHYMKYPSLLAQQTMTHITPPARAYMVERYFALDEAAAREILSRRMGRSRKDLEEVCEASGLPLNAVTRHVDNIRRVYNHVDDAEPPCNLIGLIERDFCLPTPLARQYACIVNLLLGKFNVASKKRLLRAPLSSLVACSAATLACLMTPSHVFAQLWSSALMHSTNAQDVHSGATWSNIWRLASATASREVDKDLLLSLREMKQVLLASNESIDGACTLVKASMSGADAATGLAVLNKTNAKLTSIIRQLLKNLLAIGANMSQPREMRDVYEDIVSKVAEPLGEAGLKEAEAVFLLECFRSVSSQIQRPRPLIKGLSVMPGGLQPTSSIDSSAHSVSTVGGAIPDVNVLPPPPTLQHHSSNSYVSAVYVDWCRYLTFCKICLSQLYC